MSAHTVPTARQPRWAKEIGYELDSDELLALAEFKQSKKPQSKQDSRDFEDSEDSEAFQFRLLDFQPEARNSFYDALSKNVDFAFYIFEDKKFTCVHPMIYTSKQIRAEFLGRLEGQVSGEDKGRPPRSITGYALKVLNFDFEKAIAMLELNPNLKGNGPKVFIRICHDMTTAVPNTSRFLKWTEFVAKHRKRLEAFEHQVVGAPVPASREDLIRNISKLKALASGPLSIQKREAENVEAGFKDWWKMGLGKYQWIDDEELKKMGVDRDAHDLEISELIDIGKNQHADTGSDRDELECDTDWDLTYDDIDEEEEEEDDDGESKDESD